MGCTCDITKNLALIIINILFSYRIILIKKQNNDDQIMLILSQF